jgi:hypothetical protein
MPEPEVEFSFPEIEVEILSEINNRFSESSKSAETMIAPDFDHFIKESSSFMNKEEIS